MGCSCSGTIPQRQLDSMKDTMNSRNEKIIVDWSKSTYIGGLFGNSLKEGLTCLTNLNLYFISSGWKFDQPLKTIMEVLNSDNFKEKRKGDFTIFKVEKDKEFAMLFLENKDKLREDCKSLVCEKKKSLVEIEVL